MLKILLLYLIFTISVFASGESERKRYISLFYNQGAFEYKPFQSHSFGVNIYRADLAVREKNETVFFNPVNGEVYPFTDMLLKDIAVHTNLFYKFFPLRGYNLFISSQLGMTGKNQFSMMEMVGFQTRNSEVSISSYEIILTQKPAPFAGITVGYRLERPDEPYFFSVEAGFGIKQSVNSDVSIRFDTTGFAFNSFAFNVSDIVWRQYYYKNMKWQDRTFPIVLIGFGARF